MPSEKAFALSRIRAIGWKAGQQLSSIDADSLNDAHLAAMNPYKDAAERESWANGFKEALGRQRDKAGQILKWDEKR